MRKLSEVEEAKALMNEAASWSVMKWLREKKRVRQMADKANAALDQLDRDVKAGWNAQQRKAYEEMANGTISHGNGRKDVEINAGTRQFVRDVRNADELAYRARMDAEKTFDEAERRLSTSLAREGCHKAILSWNLHEKAIHRAQTEG